MIKCRLHTGVVVDKVFGGFIVPGLPWQGQVAAMAILFVKEKLAVAVRSPHQARFFPRGRRRNALSLFSLRTAKVAGTKLKTFRQSSRVAHRDLHAYDHSYRKDQHGTSQAHPRYTRLWRTVNRKSAGIAQPRRDAADRRRNGTIHLRRVFACALAAQQVNLNQVHRIHIRVTQFD